jgi:hypothetical protein
VSDQDFKEHVVHALASLSTQFTEMDKRMNRFEGKLDKVAATCEANRQTLQRMGEAIRQPVP